MSVLKFIRKHFRDMEGYVSAGMESGKNESNIFLNANENPYPLPGLERYNRYPEPQPQKLVSGLAALYGVGDEHVVITRGADEGIALLIRMFCEPHEDAILINPPTFGVYKVDAATMPTCGVISVPLLPKERGFELDVNEIIRQARSAENSVKIVFLCSPNNPTGGCARKDDILRVVDELSGHCLVVLDETYAEFTDGASLTSELEAYENFVILRTLSKSYALAGQRVGAILSAQTELIELLKSKVMETYPIPVASVEAALHVLDPDMQKLAQKNIQKILAERKRMELELADKKGVHALYKSDANFLLIEVDRATDFVRYAATKNVIIRDFSMKPDTKDCLRLSIGTPLQNDLVLELFDAFYAA